MLQNDDGHITSEEIEFIENRSKRSPDLDLTYTRVFNPLLMANPDAETGKYTVASEDGEAHIVRKGSRYKKLKINGASVTYSVDEVGLEYEVPKSDIRLAKSFGRPLNVEYVDRTIRKVSEKINKLCYVGDVEFQEYQGVIELSGVSTYVGSDLDTASLNLFNEVRQAMNAIPQEFRSRPYFLVLADKEWQKFSLIGNTTTNESWMQMIEKNIPNVTVVLEDEIKAGAETASGTPVVTGTALLIPNDVTLIRFPVAKPIRSIIDRNSQSNEFETSLRGRVEARNGPIEVPFPLAVVKVTGWDA